MGTKKTKLMIGVNDLIAEITENSNIIFSCANPAFLSNIDRENDSHLRILIPNEYWNTQYGKIIEGRLMLKTNSDNNQTKKSVRSELSNLLTGTDGHTGIKSTRFDLAKDLSKHYNPFLSNQKKEFDTWFTPNLICENFSIKCLPNVYKVLIAPPSSGKYTDKNALYSYTISIFCKTIMVS